MWGESREEEGDGGVVLPQVMSGPLTSCLRCKKLEDLCVAVSKLMPNRKSVSPNSATCCARRERQEVTATVKVILRDPRSFCVAH